MLVWIEVVPDAMWACDACVYNIMLTDGGYLASWNSADPDNPDAEGVVGTYHTLDAAKRACEARGY